MADDLTLTISIPKADDKAFTKALDVMLAKLDQVLKKVNQVDKATKKLGKGAGGVASRVKVNAPAASGTARGARAVQGTPAVPATPPIPKDASKKIRNVSSALSLLGTTSGVAGGRLGTVVSQIATLTKAFGPLGLAIAGIIVAVGALIFIIFKAVKAFSEFEASLGNVGRVAGLEGENLIAFGKNVLRLSTELPVSTREIFKFADALANAGLRGAELDSATEAFARLGTVVKNLDTSKVQDILRLREISGTGDSIDTVNDKVLKLSQTVIANFNQITKASSQAAAAFAGTGATLDDIITIGATAAGQTKNTQRLITSLGKVRQALAALNTVPDDKLQNILDTLRDGSEISVEAFRKLAAGPGGVTLAFNKLLKDSGDLRTSLDELGLSAASTGNTLVRSFASNAELLEKASKAIAGTEAAGTVDEQAAARLEEFGAQVDILGNKFGALFVRVGSAVVTFLKPLVVLLGNVIDLTSLIFDGMASLIDQLPDYAKEFIKFVVSPISTAAEGINKLVNNSAEASAKVTEDLVSTAEEGLARLATKAQKDIESLGDVRLLNFEAINTGFIARVTLFKIAMRDAGKSAEEIDLAVAKFTNTLKGLDPALKRAEKSSDVLAQNLNVVEKTVEKLIQDQEKLEFELSITDLTGLEKTIAKIENDTKIVLSAETFDFTKSEKVIRERLKDLTGAEGIRLGLDLGESEKAIEVLEKLRESQTGKRSANTLDLIKLIQEFGGNKDAIDALAKIGQQKIQIAIEKDFQKTFADAKESLQALRDINLTPLEKAFKNLKTIVDSTFASDKLKRANVFEAQVEIAKILATNLKSVSKEVTDIQNKVNDFNLTDFKKGINEIDRGTRTALEAITLSPDQRDSATRDALALEAKLREAIIKKDRLQRLALVQEEFKKRSDLIKADREKILDTQSEGVAAVTDAGSAIEAVNQAQRDNQLQQDLLAVNDAQLVQLKKLARDAAKKTDTVVFPPVR